MNTTQLRDSERQNEWTELRAGTRAEITAPSTVPFLVIHVKNRGTRRFLEESFVFLGKQQPSQVTTKAFIFYYS